MSNRRGGRVETRHADAGAEIPTAAAPDARLSAYNRGDALVAQGIEHRPSKPRVGGSRPPGRANFLENSRNHGPNNISL